jgi:hypothetical protein
MKTLSNLALLIVATTGCSLSDDDGVKNACQSQTDCLEGFYCFEGTCQQANNTTPDAPNGDFYGTVQAMSPLSTGVAAENYRTLVGATTAAGTLGCAVVGDLEASPGVDVAVAYAKVAADSGDSRCPEGVFAIMNDPSACKPSFPGDLNPGCGLYKRWDASGKQVASQLAIGGYVSMSRTVSSSTTYRCSGELSLRFAGGVTIAKTFVFDYNPGGPSSAFCVH